MRLTENTFGKFIVLSLISLAVFAIFVNYAHFKFNTADASIYLSTAENIANHKGFVVSYNLCQCFKTLYHPIWAYYQPLYSIFCSIFINHVGIEGIIKINILIFGLNVMLIYVMIEKIMPSIYNIFFVFYLAFSRDFFFSALYAWTEQFYLFWFIISVLLFLKYKDSLKPLIGLGAFNGVLMLIRVAHVYSVMAYLPVLLIGKDPMAQKLKKIIHFAGGFILAYGSYQLLCLAAFHSFYPEYARPGENYGIARYFTGLVYQIDKVGLQVTTGPLFTAEHLSHIKYHLISFSRHLPILALPVFFYYLLPPSKRARGSFVELCCIQSFFIIFGYSLTFYWLPQHNFEVPRYSMIPFILLSLAGWFFTYQALSQARYWGKIVLIFVLFFLLKTQLQLLDAFNEENAVSWNKPYYHQLLESETWIDQNLPKDILVASSDDQQGYFMHRPFISLPPGKSLNEANLILFNQIYSPDYYLLASRVSDEFFNSIHHKVIYSNKTFRVFEIEK